MALILLATVLVRKDSSERILENIQYNDRALRHRFTGGLSKDGDRELSLLTMLSLHSLKLQARCSDLPFLINHPVAA